jgi:hypothetical protein
MRLTRLHFLAAGALTFGYTPAQIVLNELHLSMAGDDEDEYAELIAAPGTSLAGVMLLVVESDAGPVNGILDAAWDLSGNQFGATDPYYVVGNVSTAVNPDFALTGINTFENSSQTIYLVLVPDPALRATIDTTWLNTDVRTAPGATTTIIASTMGITILDSVAVVDAGTTDTPFDNALTIGPDGTFFPAGAFRSGDCPGNWCTDEYTAFSWDPNGSTNGGVPVIGAPNDPTPGAQNYLSPTCMTAPSLGTCTGSGSIGTNYCAANANSTGATGSISATGSGSVAANNVTLRASSLPNNAFAFFLVSRDAGFVANPGGSQGNLCLAGSIGRYVGPGQIGNTGAVGAVDLAIDLTQIPQPTGPVAVAAGETWRFTCWHRDVVAGSATSNFSNGLAIAFN